MYAFTSPSRSCLTLAALSVGAIAAAGCASSQGPQPLVATPARHIEIRRQVHQRFQDANFFKPNPGKDAAVARELAPLIVQQLTTGSADDNHIARFGALQLNDQKWSVDENSPTIYFETSTTFLHARPTEQVTFVWVYRKSDRNPGSQGIRITFNSHGFPVIWEVAHGAGGLRQIYVSDTLEEAAAEQFGAPLPGRRYSIEAGLSDCPDALVARLLSDGPVPMGPFVYLDKSRSAVTTLICRCMAAQADSFANDITYDLVPAADLGDAGYDLIKWRIEPAFLERCLRLPEMD